ncbi:MAG: hypothetical protein VKJ02_00330 [Snowella sp.]|nr:hypothetical protein [Snowella sp.]
MAYETMPLIQKEKVDYVIQGIELLDKWGAIAPLSLSPIPPENLKKIKIQNLDTWVAKIDETIRLLFRETDQGFLIIDILSLASNNAS